MKFYPSWMISYMDIRPAEFARAVAYRKAACYGCVSGGPEVAAKVCEIMGARVPEEAISQFAHRSVLYQPGLSAGREIGVSIGRGLGRGRVWVMVVAGVEVSAEADAEVEDEKGTENSLIGRVLE